MIETPEALRSRTMRAVKGTNTEPELIGRRLLHAAGYRYRLHVKDLPGKPDLVFPARRKVVFVHDCFWHGHHCARGDRQPKANAEYWSTKIARNKQRDTAHLATLRASGWKVATVWECEIRKQGLLGRLRKFLGRCERFEAFTQHFRQIPL